jgi:transposase
MARHWTSEEKQAFREQAVTMRRQGIGAARIAKALGISKAMATELLREEPVPSSLMRMRAKDDLRDAAVALRLEGRTYDEIKSELGVSKGSLSLWLRDLAHPSEEQREAVRSGLVGDAACAVPPDAEIARALRQDGWLLREIAEELGVSAPLVHRWCVGVRVPARASHGRSPEQLRASVRATWDAKNALADAERDVYVTAIADSVGDLSDRELDLVCAAIYWCEGTKRKPWRRSEKVTLINSDPSLIRVWVRWLTARGVGLERCYLAVNIHESADVAAAVSYWADVLGVDPSSFAKPVLKRHNPKTVRKNTGDAYVGCLVIAVRQGRTLYREIEGLWRGIAKAICI